MIGRGWSGYAAMSCVRPFAQERLRLRSDGRIALELKTAWHDGTRELVFEPSELLERLAAMTPRPETNLLTVIDGLPGLEWVAVLREDEIRRRACGKGGHRLFDVHAFHRPGSAWRHEAAGEVRWRPAMSPKEDRTPCETPSCTGTCSESRAPGR